MSKPCAGITRNPFPRYPLVLPQEKQVGGGRETTKGLAPWTMRAGMNCIWVHHIRVVNCVVIFFLVPSDLDCYVWDLLSLLQQHTVSLELWHAGSGLP